MEEPVLAIITAFLLALVLGSAIFKLRSSGENEKKGTGKRDRWEANAPEPFDTVSKSPIVEFECPKCLGRDVYFAERQVITGIGGIWGNRGKSVKKPFCRKCDVIANTSYLNKDGTPMRLQPDQMNSLANWGLILGTITILILVLVNSD